MKNIFESMKPIIINAGKAAIVAIAVGLADAVTKALTEDEKVTTPGGFTVDKNQTSIWEER